MFYFLTILNLILIVLAVFVAIQFFNMLFRGYAPFISTKYDVINKIFENINFGENFSGTVYELGSGKAGFLRAFEERYPGAKCIGIEYSSFPYFFSKIQLSLAKSKIKIRKKNMFKINLEDADVIYCYLFPNMMAKLEEKFKKECKPGTLVVSYQFILPNMKTEKILELGENSKIYLYKI
ncbi:MAG: class I SAM-dependent methyltransferase [Patescibacteria group bacterium]|nr:class I SAM-dependent methyltransferase [Patescibacteria group bacterium]MDD4611040.1 class I SAM-dependent methyltransferase [Patescibacteria group bacterium]